jgi:hypothetical protein
MSYQLRTTALEEPAASNFRAQKRKSYGCKGNVNKDWNFG